NFIAFSSLTPYGANPDSTRLLWEAKIPTSYNPFKRVRAYLKARKFEADIKSLMTTMQQHYSRIDNVYGFDIQKASVVDSTLVSTFEISASNPGIEKVYALIDQLKRHVAMNGAVEKGHPMLNISPYKEGQYITRVAIPVDKILPTSGNITYKWMLGGGNILITEVKGGQLQINKAFEEIENYVIDHRRAAPAIPFLSLVTDRRLEPDSTKWVTKIYYPVM
ncbi:MAG: GyrI-like domain-containing protein, partial [Chitinophagaceae bacterium]|nr:GyrI-like domain-containing protein [Chitinophagaceae bacterium]